MERTTYTINKNINKPIEFKGFKAQYIWWLGGGLLVLLIFFAVLYFIGISSYICLAIVVVLGGTLCVYVQKISNKYGEHGLMKAIARKKIPKVVKQRSRAVYLRLNK